MPSAAEGRGSIQGPAQTRGAAHQDQRRARLAWPRAQAFAAATAPVAARYGGEERPGRGAPGTLRGEGGDGASGQGRGGSEEGFPRRPRARSGQPWCPRALATRGAREGEQETTREAEGRVNEAGCPFKRAQRRWDARRHGAGRWGAAALHGGHAAFHRTHVVRGSGWRGTRFWACSGLI